MACLTVSQLFVVLLLVLAVNRPRGHRQQCSAKHRRQLDAGMVPATYRRPNASGEAPGKSAEFRSLGCCEKLAQTERLRFEMG